MSVARQGRSHRLGRQLVDEDRGLTPYRGVPAPGRGIPASRSSSRRFTTGGGTFAALTKIDGWLAAFRPTMVVFNYGGNDAGTGWEGLARFKDNMARCVAGPRSRRSRRPGNPQAADVRKSGLAPAANRTPTRNDARLRTPGTAGR